MHGPRKPEAHAPRPPSPMPADALTDLLRLADPEARARQYAEQDADFINLAVAENVLIYPLLKRNVFDTLPPFPVEATKYKPSSGTPAFREATASVLTQVFGTTVSPGHVFAAAGVSAALECLGFILFDPDAENVVLTAAPCWQGFGWSFEQRPPNGRLVTFRTRAPQISLQDVQDAFEANPDARLLVLNSPQNPLGICYAQRALEEIYTWVLNNTNADIVSDEMFAHSQVDANVRPPGSHPFVSALALTAYKDASDKQKARVHVVWGFAKDFGLSGFKAGVIVSTSETVLSAMTGRWPMPAIIPPPRQDKDMAWFTPVNALKSYVLTHLLTAPPLTTDEDEGEDDMGSGVFWPSAIRHYRRNLTLAWQATRRELGAERLPIPFFEGADSAQFVWLDLSAYLDKVAPLGDGETTLYPEIDPSEAILDLYIRRTARVGLLPGETLSNPEPGWFRLCYTAEPWTVGSPKVIQAIKRIRVALIALNGA